VLLTVAAANYFANSYQIGFSGDRYPEPLPAGVYEELKITRDDFDEVESQVNGEIEKAKIFLQVTRQ
jgi:hypothetical protein